MARLRLEDKKTKEMGERCSGRHHTDWGVRVEAEPRGWLPAGLTHVISPRLASVSPPLPSAMK